MNTLTKVLLGVGAVSAVAVTAYIINKKEKPIYNTDTVEAEEVTEDETKESEENVSVLVKIKRKVLRALIKGLAWVALHQEQIESACTVISLCVGLFNIINAVRDFRSGNKMQEQIDELVMEKDNFKQAWNTSCDSDETNINTLMETLKDIKLDIGHVEHIIKEGA